MPKILSFDNKNAKNAFFILYCAHLFVPLQPNYIAIHILMTFEELGVSSEILQAITEMGFVNPMPVQEEVIPFLLNTKPHIASDTEDETEKPNDNTDGETAKDVNASDLIALAQTGTGKTAAFGIPLLQRLDTDSRQTQALVLSPTRELCLQIADDIRDFSKYMKGVHVVPVYGGASIEQQIRALRHGANIIVATPGRLIDLINRGKADITEVATVVLDEADEMLNMGFSESINEIFEHLPKERNTLLFSATMSREIEKIALSYLHNHREIVVGSRNEGAENVNHIYYMVNAKDKYLALKRIVDYNPRIFAIIFCRTKIETQEIADKLIKDGYNAEALHGDLSQQQRDLTMQKFRQHLTQLLVATDVAARGLDVDDLTHVINFGLPEDIENYTHRSGRTGRAGKKGTSISIVHSREKHKIRRIEKEIGKEFVEQEIPKAEEICKKQLYKVMDQIVKTDVEEEQIAPFMKDISRYFEYIDKEDIIKKIVSIEFGKFLSYYANAPEIEKPASSRKRSEERGERREGGRRSRKAEEGMRRLFINLGKKDGFYPGELMQFLNRNLSGRQEVGHIDLQNTISFFDVPEEDASRVMRALTGKRYKGREVRCNDGDADKRGERREERGERKARNEKKRERRSDRDFGSSKQNEPFYAPFIDGRKGRSGRQSAPVKGNARGGDWRQFFQKEIDLRGTEPDFSEEGWARRRPKKKNG